MHEATIAESILKLISSKLKETPNATRVTRVHVIAGEFRNVDRESLEFAFDNLKNQFDGTDKCQLQLEMTAARALCKDQNHSYHPQADNAYRCSVCGNGIGKLVAGDELDIVNINLEAMNQTRTTGQDKNTGKVKHARHC